MKQAVSALRIALLFALPLSAAAELRLPHAISDHAVLQRGGPIHIWGWATPGALISANFHNQTVPALTDRLGHWNLWLAPEVAGGPYTLTVSGDGPAQTVTDLLVGDVWLASGQSNMEIPLDGFGPTTPIKNAAQEIASANNPKIRLLLTPKKSSDVPMDDSPATWTTCTPETARKFSAVAYFFGREIAARENVPIGLVDTTWGGTPADSWLSLDTLGTNPELLPAFASRARFADAQADAQAMIAAEKREDEEAKAAGKPAPSHFWHPQENTWLPAALYNGMIAPYTPMSLKGFLWYQGEANSAHDRAPYYEALMDGLIGDWRMHFKQGDLPFFYVQLASFTSPGEDWGQVRDAQRRTLSVANTAMAVTLDVGQADNVHPPDKQTVAARLALAARNLVYGEQVPYSSPLFREATTELQADGSLAMRVYFNHGEGLTYRGKPATGFEVAGADGKFIAADAKVEHDSVLVSTSGLARPMYVRFGWMGVVENNLYNAAGLPASTFTSQPPPARFVQ
ncbi:MAG: sialate O-acetylesterase [Janthinobacterium lividum]